MKSGIIAIIIIMLMMCVPALAVAGTIIFPLDYEISGGANPQGSTPWATATFIDVSSNTVQLTMSSANLTGSEFITQWLFNSGVDPSTLTFTAVDTSDVSAPTIDHSIENHYKADGDGYFDIRFNFQTASGSGRFEDSETVIYNITGSSIDASTFNYKSFVSGGAGIYESVAKVQGISGDDNTSGWIANTTVVLEPVSSTLFIVGGGILGFRQLRRKKL